MSNVRLATGRTGVSDMALDDESPGKEDRTERRAELRKKQPYWRMRTIH